MSKYSVAVLFDQTTKLFTVTEPAGLEIEELSLDAVVAALPDKAQAAYNLPPGSADALELHVTIPPLPPVGPTGTTGATGTNGLSGASGASGPTGM